MVVTRPLNHRPPVRSRGAARPLADFAEACLAPVIAKQGFGAADIILHWPEIVGSRLASACEPVKLRWPPRKTKDEGGTPAATLVVRVEGHFALELQHLAPVVVARANTFLGWRGIDRLVLRQGPSLHPARQARPAPPSAADHARSAQLTAGIEEPALRDALTRLGAGVFRDGQ